MPKRNRYNSVWISLDGSHAVISDGKNLFRTVVNYFKNVNESFGWYNCSSTIKTLSVECFTHIICLNSYQSYCFWNFRLNLIPSLALWSILIQKKARVFWYWICSLFLLICDLFIIKSVLITMIYRVYKKKGNRTSARYYTWSTRRMNNWFSYSERSGF
jgi:hypothetical protein